MSSHTRRRAAGPPRSGGARSDRLTVVPAPTATLHLVEPPAANAQTWHSGPGNVVWLRRAAAAPPTRQSQLRAWIRRHRVSLVILVGLLLAVGLVHWTGYDRFPMRATDDEGTYVSQAYAVQQWQALAHYTYWYDHRPSDGSPSRGTPG